MDTKLCLVQVLDYEAQTTKNKKILECKNCPFKDKCNRKTGEQHGQTD